MIELRKCKALRKPNYRLLPCNQTDDVDEFNEVLAVYRERDKEMPFTWITRTPSGGISIQNFRGHQIDLISTHSGCELTVLDYDGYFRLQLTIGDLKYQQRRKALSEEQKNEIEKCCEKIEKIMAEMKQK